MRLVYYSVSETGILGKMKSECSYQESTVALKCHGNFNFITAISISPRQFQFHHGNFNFVHGNFNFVTAVSISPRQFQLRSRQFQLCHGNFNFTTAISTLFTAISTSPRQFQFHHDNFNFVTAISTSFTAISISISPQGVHKSCEKEINC